MNSNLFCSGSQLNNLLITSGLLQSSWKAISDTRSDLSLSATRTVEIKTYELPGGVEVIAFVPSADFTAKHLEEVGDEVVPSHELQMFDFISKLPFCIRRAAVDLFKSLHDQLSQLKDKQIKNPKQLIITGQSVGGSVATLFALWLQHNIDLELERAKKAGEKKPAPKPWFCIVYGSPLVGDDGFQKAILERPQWVSRFLNVVSVHDPVPRLSMSTTHKKDIYKPFGIYLFCSESGGCASFEDHESIVLVMQAISSYSTVDDFVDYGKILELLEQKALFGGISELVGPNLTSLAAGISLQLQSILQETDNRDKIVEEIEKKLGRLLRKRKDYFEPTKKLNKMKEDMAHMEWYKKEGSSRGGYYDNYKNDQKSSTEVRLRDETVFRQRSLIQYWEKVVDDKAKMPQKEGASLRSRWLYGGTNYRRMVEPLEIAKYYKAGGRDYINKGRSTHFILLEEWMDEDIKERGIPEPRKRACSLTEDSCFWAHVEEANISCKVLKDAQSSPDDKASSERRLEEFEKYVMNLIKSFSVSKEIFLEQSSFMKWWKDYKEIKGTTYHSPLAEYMRNDYQSYA